MELTIVVMMLAWAAILLAGFAVTAAWRAQEQVAKLQEEVKLLRIAIGRNGNAQDAED